jgi:hypothetical protein
MAEFGGGGKAEMSQGGGLVATPELYLTRASWFGAILIERNKLLTQQ